MLLISGVKVVGNWFLCELLCLISPTASHKGFPTSPSLSDLQHLSPQAAASLKLSLCPLSAVFPLVQPLAWFATIIP